MNITEETKDMLCELMNMGIGEASIALSETLNQYITLKVPEVLILTFDEMLAFVNSHETKNYVHVIQKMHGTIKGLGVLSFPLENGKALVDTLLQNDAESEGDEFTSWEIEAIQEVGNMVINSLGMAIADTTGIKIRYELPEIFFSENIYPVSKVPEQEEDIFCFATTTFYVKNLDVLGCVNLVLTNKSVQVISDKLIHSLKD